MEKLFPPSSPGVSPVQVSDCIEHLLRFVLSSYINETLEFDLGLSKEYCTDLLIDDPADLNLDGSDTAEGVPLYPLYKSLASALCQFLTSGYFQRTSSGSIFQEDKSIKQKEDEWNKLVMDKGSELINMLKAVEFELHVQEPFFSQLRAGQKSIEGRCAVGNYNQIGSGALLLFNKCLLLEVKDVRRYASFSEMLELESLPKVLPGVNSIEEGVQIYRKFYSEEKEKSNGVLAIFVTKPTSQPYLSLASIISGLSYEGIRRLLGLAHTVESAPDALPPPRSALLSSFVMPHKPNVKVSTLTKGARALAKHVNRSIDRWWGNFDGNDTNKNRLALEIIGSFIAHCCWMNIHIVQPYGGVFEIRVAEGYGARWSKDGSKFIGFLEPYMDNGHSNGWKH